MGVESRTGTNNSDAKTIHCSIFQPNTRKSGLPKGLLFLVFGAFK
jgi:hypothetical protein